MNSTVKALYRALLIGRHSPYVREISMTCGEIRLELITDDNVEISVRIFNDKSFDISWRRNYQRVYDMFGRCVDMMPY